MPMISAVCKEMKVRMAHAYDLCSVQGDESEDGTCL